MYVILATLLFGESSAAVAWQSVVDFLTANPILGYPIWVGVLSVVAFLMYGWDKRQAKTDGWRVPKKRLHTVAFLGGWPGAMFGQKLLPPQNAKNGFQSSDLAGCRSARRFGCLVSLLQISAIVATDCKSACKCLRSRSSVNFSLVVPAGFWRSRATNQTNFDILTNQNFRLFARTSSKAFRMNLLNWKSF